MPFVCAMFMKMSRQFSKGEVLSFDWLCTQVGRPFSPPETILDLVHLEAVHDVFDLYLWLSYRFSDLFPDVEIVREVQNELDTVIEDGVVNIVQLLKNSETGVSSGTSSINEGGSEMKRRQNERLKNKWTHREEKKVRSDDGRGVKVVEGGEKGVGGGAAGPGKVKLTERLLAQGLITTEMLAELRRELKNDK